MFGNQPDPIPVTRQLPGNHLIHLEREDWLGQHRIQVGQTDRSSRWDHVHPGSVGKPRTRAKGQRHSRPIEDTYGGVRPYGDVIQEFGQLEKLAKSLLVISVCYAGKPDTAMSCPSGLEGAWRKRISAMRLRAAIRPYSQGVSKIQLIDDLQPKLHTAHDRMAKYFYAFIENPLIRYFRKPFLVSRVVCLPWFCIRLEFLQYPSLSGPFLSFEPRLFGQT